MKTTFLSGLIILTGLYACQPSSKTENANTESTNQTASASVITLPAQEFAAKSPAGTIVDVRTASEVAQGKIEGALVIDFYSPDFLDQVSQISKDQNYRRIAEHTKTAQSRCPRHNCRRKLYWLFLRPIQ